MGEIVLYEKNYTNTDKISDSRFKSFSAQNNQIKQMKKLPKAEYANLSPNELKVFSGVRKCNK